VTPAAAGAGGGEDTRRGCGRAASAQCRYQLPAGLDDVFQARAGLARRLAGHPQDSRAGSSDRRRGRGLSPGRSPGSWTPNLLPFT
jgi:hypothetical protein